MGIKYDPIDHVLYLADYGYDRIERITFESSYSFKFKYIESILTSDYGQQALLNPLMSVFHDDFIFWIDFEDGLKTTVYKSSCQRSIYKIHQATSLKFIQIGTFHQMGDEHAPENDEANLKEPMHSLNKLVSLQANENLKYPPDYYVYNENYRKNSIENFDRSNKLFQKLHSMATSNAVTRQVYSGFVFIFVIYSYLFWE